MSWGRATAEFTTTQEDTVSPQLRTYIFVPALVLGLAVPAVHGAPQSEPPASPSGGEFFETVDVEVVNVEVFVTDKKGNPVAGLSAADFEVLEDGKPVEITNFYAARGAAPAPDPTAEPDALAGAEPPASPPVAAVPDDQRLNVVILIDNQNLLPQTRNRVLRALKASTDAQLREGDRVMVASYDGSLNVRQGLTADRDAIVAALDEAGEVTPAGVQAMMDRAAILRELQQVDLEETADSLSEGAFSDSSGPDFSGILFAIRTYTNRRYQEIERTVAAMTSFVDTLSGLKGRKALIYVSDGLPIRPGEALFQAYQSKRAAGGGGAFADVSQFESQEFDATALFEELGRHANANQVTLYTVLAGGGQSQTLNPAERSAFFSLSDPTNLGQVWNEGLESIESLNHRSSMEILADATGGLATLSTLDFSSALGRIQKDFETYYSLGYQPPRERDGKHHKIKVRVQDKALVVRHREGYRAKNAEEEMESRTLAALLYEVGENPLGVVVDVGEEQKAEKGRFLVQVMVKFPIAKLLLVPQERFHEGRVSIYVAARDSEGRMSPIQQMPAPVRIPNEKLVTALGQVAGYRMTLMLRPEEHDVVVGVRDELADVESVARIHHTPGTSAAGGT